MNHFKPSIFFDYQNWEHSSLFLENKPVWNVLELLHDYILSIFQKPPPPGSRFLSDQILIGEGSTIEEGALIKGPTIIGKNTQIRHGAYIRGNCLIGDDCVVGHTTEIKNSIMMNGAQAGHFAYIGDSILGQNVNLGAGTKLANLKMVPGNVKIKIKEEKVDTGRRKLGAILGDHVETGCNSVTSPGTLMGPNSLIYPTLSVPGGCYPAKTIITPSKNSITIR